MKSLDLNLPSESDPETGITDTETVSMNELMGIENVTLLGGGEPAYFTGTMGPDWDRNNLQYFLHLSDYTGDYRVTVAATDMMDILLPRPQNMTRDKEIYKRMTAYVEQAVQRAQLRRSLKLLDLDGIESEEEIYVPVKIDKPITFVPFEMYNDFHRDLLQEGHFIKGFHSTMFEVFKDDGCIR